jgi:hypothetical protein
LANLNCIENELTDRIAQHGAKTIYEEHLYNNLKKI